MTDDAEWSVGEHYSQAELFVSENGVTAEQAVVDPADCGWDADGDLDVQ